MANQTIPQRSEVPEEYTWNLKDLYESDQAWNEEYKALKTLPEQIAAFRGTLGRSAEDLLAWFRLQDQVEERLSRLYGYASCKGDEDTGNSFYQDMRGKAMSTLVTISSAAAFATPEIMEIPEDTLNLFYTAQPELETYRRSLYQIRRRKAHILSPAEEKLLASAGEMANASENVASVFRNADMVYPDVVDEAGNAHQLTDATFVPMLMSPDRELRRRAFETYYKALGQYKNTVAATLDGQFKQLCFFANARHYDSTLQASLDATEVPVPVYLNLIEAVHGNLDKMYRYVALRKKVMGVDELHMYDVYTPIVADADKEITSATVETVSMEGIEPDQGLRELPAVKSAQEKTVSFIQDNVLGHASADFQPVDEIKGIPSGRIEDTAVIDLIGTVQLENSGADVTAVALFKDTSDLKKGDLNYGNLFDIYKYPNVLYTVKVSGAEMKAYMEWAAACWNQWKEGDVSISFNPQKPGYLHDHFIGLNYEVNLRKTRV